ncbi:MAG TPA: K(+)-transporting ATPase subunit C [Gaiellaceae bacterium]|nr:K(+)-transporting ATPase subunit C [Gaiellaceae bacterium]
MRRQLVPALVVFLALTVLTGVAYPLALTGVAQVVFPGRADGSLIERDGQTVGSRLLGRQFSSPRYFHPRPSAAGDGYDAMASSASNLGPTNEEFLSEVRTRVAAYRRENGLARGAEVPADAVTASGSGLDPHISPANARIQAARVARARGLGLDEVLALVDEHTDGRSLGFLGEPGVNVLELNLALDRAGG